MTTSFVDSQSDLAPTIQARITALLRAPGGEAVAQTIVEQPGVTIRPGSVKASSRGKGAVEALRALGASLSGKIELHKTLGEGGMGIVRLATQATIGRHVAVKTVRSDIAASDDATLRILREAWVTGALEHPNVVPVYDVGVDEAGSPVIVMKRIEGECWSDLAHAHDRLAERFPREDPFDWNLRILEQVCNAVHFAHSRGILHRDLKPENVMIGAFGEVYVLDWGIAVSLREDDAGRLPLAANANDIAGTPHYMAPEMMMGDPGKLSERTDVYLLGAILYEIFAETPPHTGSNLSEFVTHILSSPIDYPDAMPAEVKAICARAMSREPEKRYESAEAFRVAVDEYLRHRGSRKLAREARQSHALLEEAIRGEAGEERDQEVARLLGECRFGYRAALSAWADNAEARVGLDGALLLVVEYWLAGGELAQAESLLREVSDKPEETVKRIEKAHKERVQHDERLHKLEAELDASVGTRTRSALGAIFGTIWTASPLLGWYVASRRGVESPVVGILAPIFFLVLSAPAFLWGRESLTKTRVNRNLTLTVALYLVAQFLLALGAYVAGFSPHQVHLVSMFAWALLYSVLSVWMEPWLAVVAATCFASFFLAAFFPAFLFPLMSFDNLVLTVVIVRVWLPKGDIERFHDRIHEEKRRLAARAISRRATPRSASS
jgi:serine/threonine-protein kinase